MRWFRFAVLVLVASILQTGPVGLIGIHSDIRPDLLLILLVFFSLRSNTTDAIITSFAIGFVADLSMSSSALSLMGPRIISFGLFGTLLSDLNSTLYVRRVLYQALTIFVMSDLTTGLTCLLTLLRAGTVVTNLTTAFLWQPLYSALLGPFLFLLVGWSMRMYGRSRRSSLGRALLRR
jgi:rod shape-determining protein MreD